MKSTKQYLPLCLLGLSISLGFPTILRPQLGNAQSTTNIRSVEVKRVLGQVTFRNSSTRVRTGDRLTRIGQGLSTGARSSAVLGMDLGIGTINVAANTSFFLQELSTTRNGGRVTVLKVTKGQVRLNVRQFNNAQSKLEVHTDAGIAGVRGTEFGVAVSDVGQMNVMTNEGTVEVTGGEASVLVKAGYASIVVEGKAPTEPRSFTENLDLNVQAAPLLGSDGWFVVGKVDPLNLVWVNGEPVQVLTMVLLLQFMKICREKRLWSCGY
ncbi:MAG: FecR domain-containing protein [Limnothrix sp. RL_2_0]|nr:FecR domain-containing protein [Limnothrix sp. RL_2_0]